MESDVQSEINVRFHVPFTHRLRFTRDCFGLETDASEWASISELIETNQETAEKSSIKIHVWVDDGLVSQDDSFFGKLTNCFGEQGSSYDVRYFPLVGGEPVKNDPSIVEFILSKINEDGLDRRSYIVAIGGGAMLDVVGYAAAIAHRGIRLIRFPTTTLAQADSGVGVKNAVNYFGKKNWKGTFAVPWAVVNDQALLTQLPDRDFCCGFSEAIKVALLKSESRFRWLCDNAKRIASRDLVTSSEAIRSSVKMHLDHITQGGDPFEALEARPLDFGHWSAHKLESLTNYEVRHGEAVAIGVAIDVIYSHLVHGLAESAMLQSLQALKDLRLPIYHPQLGSSELIEGIEEFRQHLGGRLTITMLESIGKPINVHSMDKSAIENAIDIAKSNA